MCPTFSEPSSPLSAPASSRPPPAQSCFVICPLGDEGSQTRRRSDEVSRHIIAGAAAANGLTLVRPDAITRGGLITSQIIEHLVDDAMSVADLTDHNPNVFYELAIRHAANKPVLLLIRDGQSVPFDLQNMRVIKYVLASDQQLTADSAAVACSNLTTAITDALSPEFKPVSPLTLAAALARLRSDTQSSETLLLQTVLDKISSLGATVAEIHASLGAPGPTLSTAAPGSPSLGEKLQDLVERYSRELDLLKSVKDAGITHIFRWREQAAKVFAVYVRAETRELSVVGSSLKGLLQKPDYSELADAIKSRIQSKIPVRFLLTHPRVADLRANQESRHWTDIGKEIVESLHVLRQWGVPSESIRFYLATPTCFGIKTSSHMLINPYPYMSVSYDFPCLVFEAPRSVESSTTGYIYNEFSVRHFDAWNKDLAIPIDSYEDAIRAFSGELDKYANAVKNLLGVSMEGPLRSHQK